MSDAQLRAWQRKNAEAMKMLREDLEKCNLREWDALPN